MFNFYCLLFCCVTFFVRLNNNKKRILHPYAPYAAFTFYEWSNSSTLSTARPLNYIVFRFDAYKMCVYFLASKCVEK